jgi:Mg2+ and Co2+ transporter CorA
MKILKILSIIGIVLSSISFISIMYLIDFDPEAASGWGIILFLYFLPLSIVVLVHSTKK